MTCKELYELMDDPGRMSEKSLVELKQIVDDYPYFHAARMLYLQNMAIVEDIRLNVDLKKMAIYIPDRQKLFTLLDVERYLKPKNEGQDHASMSSDVNKFSLVDRFLSDKATDDKHGVPDEPLVFSPPVSGDYLPLLQTDELSSDVSSVKMQHQELIDSFIESDSERMGRRIILEPPTDEVSNPDIEDAPPHTEKGSLDSSYFTETLAHVYIKQRRYDKALEIIKSLSLKYPEKNIYFADQIRFLEKLIIHTKK